VGFGAWAIGGNNYGNSYGPTDDKVSLAAVEKAFELGCNFYDTADVYGHGHSEKLLGQALKEHRDDVILATKVGGEFYHDPPRMNFNPEYLEFASAKSCERLQTDHIDLYQLHNPPVQLLKSGKIFDGLEKLKDSGRIRHYASRSMIRRGTLVNEIWTARGHPSRIQPSTSRGKEPALPSSTRSECRDLSREKPLSNGFLAGKFTMTQLSIWRYS